MARVRGRRSEARQAGEVGGWRRGVFVVEPRGTQRLHHWQRQVLEQPGSAPLAIALAPSTAATAALGLVRAAAAASHRCPLRLLALLALLALLSLLALALALALAAFAARARPAPPAADRSHNRRAPSQQ